MTHELKLLLSEAGHMINIFLSHTVLPCSITSSMISQAITKHKQDLTDLILCVDVPVEPVLLQSQSTETGVLDELLPKMIFRCMLLVSQGSALI